LLAISAEGGEVTFLARQPPSAFAKELTSIPQPAAKRSKPLHFDAFQVIVDLGQARTVLDRIAPVRASTRCRRPRATQRRHREATLVTISRDEDLG
jgi:hypothetical protein